MTIAASNSSMQQKSSDLRIDFAPAELTSQIRQASSQNLTGYWTIAFDATPEHKAMQWYISLVEGRVVYCGGGIPTSKDFIDVMQRFSGLRKGALGQHLKLLRSRQIAKQDKQMKKMLGQLVNSGIVSLEEMEAAFRIYILNDFDRYLLHSGGGHALFTEAPELKDYVPLRGLELNSILIESIRRRVEWTAFKPHIPSLEAILTLPSKSANGVSLQEAQWQTLKGLIQDGKTLTDMAQSMGKDSLVVAKSFLNLIQQQLIIVHSDVKKPLKEAKSGDRMPSIFIVDDSPLLIRQFRSLLEHWGYIVNASEDSVNAVDKIMQSKPDVIFLDVNMPVVSGFDLIKQIRRQAQLASIPLVMLTAEKSVSNQWRAQWASCKFLAKPRSADDVSDFRVELQELLRALAPRPSDILV